MQPTGTMHPEGTIEAAVPTSEGLVAHSAAAQCLYAASKRGGGAWGRPWPR